MENVPLWEFRFSMSLVIFFSALSLEKKNHVLLAVGFGFILVDWFSDIFEGAILHSVLRTSTLLFVLWIVGSLMVKFLRQKEVGLISLLQAINGYLLLDILFSGLVVLLHNNSPGAYHSSTGVIRNNDLIYYSIITLSTTGFGDILPLTPGAKNLAMITAVSGQIYVAFLVGVLVGRYTSNLSSAK